MSRPTALPIMQSGFVAPPHAGVQRPGDRRDPFTDYSLNEAYRRNAQDGFFLPEITELHREMLANVSVMRDAEWNIRLMRAMREGFGPDFVAWLKLQCNQPTVGQAQIRFLKDTMHYLKTGRRTMSRQGHIAAMAREVSSADSAGEISKILLDFPVVNQSTAAFAVTACSTIPRNVEDVYLRWINYRDGIDDLVETLYAIFGRRDTTNSFQDKFG